jgi:hypothetical protein
MQAEVLKPFPGQIEGAIIGDDSEHFVAPNGINTVVKHFVNLSGKACLRKEIDSSHRS